MSLLLVYLKLDRPRVSADSWIYLPEKAMTVHRVCEFKNFSADCAPPDKTMVCAEITCRRGDPIWRASDRELSEVAVRDLARIGLVEARQVVGALVKRIPNAYPVYHLRYEDDLSPVLDWVAGLRNLRTIGRQGRFGYTTMYESVVLGRDVGRALAPDRAGAPAP